MNEQEFKQKLFSYISNNSIKNPFNDKISIVDIKAFETKNNITLPIEYKFFLTEIGNVGFGPGYGIIELKKSVIYSTPFSIKSNPNWIEHFNWDNDRP